MWPFDPPVGGHLTFPKGHLTLPKRSRLESPGGFLVYIGNDMLPSSTIGINDKPRLWIPMNQPGFNGMLPPRVEKIAAQVSKSSIPRLPHLRGRRDTTFSCETFAVFLFFKDQKKWLNNWQHNRGGDFFSEFFLPFTNKSLKIRRVLPPFFQVARSSEASEQPKVWLAGEMSNENNVSLSRVYIGDEILTCYVGKKNKSLWGSLGICCNGLFGKIIYLRWVV